MDDEPRPVDALAPLMARMEQDRDLEDYRLDFVGDPRGIVVRVSSPKEAKRVMAVIRDELPGLDFWMAKLK